MAPTSLPAVIEAEALAFARKWLQDMRTTDFNGWGVSPFDANSGAVLVNQLMLILLQGNLQQALIVLDLARARWWPADRAIRDVNAEHARRGLPPMPLLTEFAARHLDGEPPPSLPRGRSKIPNLLSDLALCALIMTLCEDFGLKPTRNPSAPRPSACSIVARAASEAGLHRGGESAINKIWKRYARAVTFGWLHNSR
jgi:hypothetical protein